MVLFSIRNAFNVLCNITVFVAFTIIGKFVNSMENVWHYMSLTALVIGLITSVVFLIGVQERRSKGTPDERKQRRISSESYTGEGTRTWRCWFKVPCFYYVGGVYMCARLLVNVSQVYLVIYSLDCLDMPLESQAYMPLALYLASFFANFTMKAAADRYSLAKIITVGSVFSCAALLALWLLAQAHLLGNLPTGMKSVAYLAVLFLGFGNATVLVSALSMEAKLVGHHTCSGAFVYGAMSFLDKLSNGIVVFAINSFGSEGSGTVDHPDDVTHAYKERMTNLFVFVPAFSAVIGCVFAYMCKFDTDRCSALSGKSINSSAHHAFHSGSGAYHAVDSDDSELEDEQQGRHWDADEGWAKETKPLLSA